MCGINGIFAYHSAASSPKEEELLLTRDAMRRRGPDGAGLWWSDDRRCALGHRRLTIIDLSDRAAQPMVSADGRFSITFNGEIYNYRELRAELAKSGAQFRTESDTEVLLQLYKEQGPAMVGRLRGMFAFAIWDGMRRELFLARDPYGIKPLYSANDGWTFRFASQVKALLAGNAISRDPEPAGLVGFHLFGSVPEPFTLYRDVRALPAGHTQLVDAGGPREPQPFVRLAAILAEGAARTADKAPLHEHVRAGALSSVKAHLVADVEVGLFLSAGVDSAAILGLTRDVGSGRVRAITLGFDEFRGTADDEVPIAAQAAERYGADHIVRRVTKQEFDADLPSILDAMDQPSIDGINTWFVAKAAKEAGLKVALSGLGGDELLAGYPSFVDVPRWYRQCGPLARIPGLGRVARRAAGALAPEFTRKHPKALGLLEYAASWAGAYLLRRGLFLPFELPQIMDPWLAREGLRRLQPLRRLAETLRPDPRSWTGRVCALESCHYMRNQLLRDADWAGMAHGIEIRVPFVDVQLLRSLSPVIPSITPGAGKRALAAAPSAPLPAQIEARAKTGFAVPTSAWAKSTTDAEKASPTPRGLASRRWSKFVLARSPVAASQFNAI